MLFREVIATYRENPDAVTSYSGRARNASPPPTPPRN